MEKNIKINRIISVIAAIIIGLSLYLTLGQWPSKPTKQSGRTTVATSYKSSKAISYPDTITGDIVTLKKLTYESAFDYYTMFSDSVRKDYEFPEKVTYSYVEYFVRLEVEKMKKGKVIAYNIWDNKVNKMVGSIQIREKVEVDLGQLGMWINENFRGGGRIQEALYLISKAYFDAKPNITSYCSHVRPWNIASMKAMKKFGFTKVGTITKDEKQPRYVPRHVLELSRETIAEKTTLRSRHAAAQ